MPLDSERSPPIIIILLKSYILNGFRKFHIFQAEKTASQPPAQADGFAFDGDGVHFLTHLDGGCIGGVFGAKFDVVGVQVDVFERCFVANADGIFLFQRG